MTKHTVLATGVMSKLIQCAPENSPAELPATTSVEGIREQDAILEAGRSHSQDKGRLSEGSYSFSLAVESVCIEIHVEALSLQQVNISLRSFGALTYPEKIAGQPGQRITMHIMDPNGRLTNHNWLFMAEVLAIQL